MSGEKNVWTPTKGLRRHAQLSRRKLLKGSVAAAVAGLEFDGTRLRAQLADPQLDLIWRPRSTDCQEAVSLCFASGGSATQARSC